MHIHRDTVHIRTHTYTVNVAYLPERTGLDRNLFLMSEQRIQNLKPQSL